MNWEIILWTSVTVAVFIFIMGIIIMTVSAKNMKNSRNAMLELQDKIKVGAKIMFCGGVYGKIVKIDGDKIDVEISKGVVITILRYAIQNVC